MKPTVLVLGSGPIRIGQGIEFDYSCVHCVWSLREMGYRAIIVNNNPETVSTDFDTGDGLYFEPVTLEDVLDVIAHENPIGVVCQFGGQTAINLAQGLSDSGIAVLGTSPAAIASAEDREQFDALLEELDIPRPRGKGVRSLEQAKEIAREVGYPVLVRPSFVLGGRGMEIVFSEGQLEGFYREAEDANPGQPVLVDKYLLGKEAEVDVISDGEETLVPGIMEHIERAGVHSGDSMAVYPPVSLSANVQAQMVTSACKIARALGVKGLMNIQFVIQDEIAYVLEVNPRASRTVPYLSKVTGIRMVDLATRCMMGEKLRDMGYASGLWILSGSRSKNLEQGGEAPCALPEFADMFGLTERKPPTDAPGNILRESEFIGGAPSLPAPFLYAIKAPVFSFQKLGRVEPSLGPEMKSTGEILGIDNTFEGALYKALVASGINFKGDGCVLMTVRDDDKPMALEIARGLHESGRQIAATPGTADILQQAGIPCERVNKIQLGSPNILDLIMAGRVSLMINTPGLNETSESEAARIRRACIETGIPCVTSIDTAAALIRALEVFANPTSATCLRLEEYFA
ncbi:carbamoyl-phosphate synthase, large subunit [Fimbriimonas ginsengisoli Gsoil 348]|uniref:Carbamoyl-phosphate synthase, large subunit n=1 Tax=Fimbriimonas ginsengisoli Gsoil 348 TaxID=661478 RepID=A0A068NW13_FIMGI|nr:carbamoyl-phosphate synthase large subunit [Fimbriimonas ginsengisoli]AIE87621.1 carbamoyl-phosphate synthase, large subunit [Fimbriimonas ginsengisoli Gsoil 348]